MVRLRFGKEPDGCGNMRKDQPRIGANRKASLCSPLRTCSPHLNPPFRRGESDLQFLSLAIQLRCIAHPSSGSFGQILSPPQRLPTAIPLSVSFCDCQKRTIISYVMINEHLSHGRRWGADRICPNGPDEGRASRGTRLVRVRISKSDSDSKPSACGIRADSRLVFLLCLH